MDIAQAGRNCRNRVVEWLCAAMLLNFGFTCMVWPETISRGSFRYLTDIGVTPIFFTSSCLFVGFMRVIALAFNGQGLPWSARVRAVCAIFGGVVFAHMAWMLVYLTRDTQTLSLGVGTHALLALAECYSCMRAGADVSEINKSHARNGNGKLVTTVMANESPGPGNQPDQNGDRSSRTVPNSPNGGSLASVHDNRNWQLSLFERNEVR